MIPAQSTNRTAMDSLIDNINRTGAPIVVGLDPRLSQLPREIRERCQREFGKTSEAVAQAFLLFNAKIIDAIADVVPAVKPQVAFYEQYGHRGMWAYEETIRYARAKGLVVIGDIKRSDIGSTAQAYADGHIGEVEWWEGTQPSLDCDFVTVNPYLGSDGLLPFLDWCKRRRRGLFVLLKTSNPSSSEIQDLELASGGRLYEHVGRLVARLGAEVIGESGYSSVGAVVGATYPEEMRKLRKQLPQTFFLVPGYGAQGAGVGHIIPAFDETGGGAIVNSSRDIIFAFSSARRRPSDEAGFAEAARAAATEMRDTLAAGLAAAGRRRRGRP